MRIIYLDIDGVLHPREESDNSAGWLRWLATLESLLANEPDVYLVVHSTWRDTHSDDELRALMGTLSGRFLGCAPRVAKEEAIEMLQQANTWIVRAHLVLDDDPREFTSGRLNVVFCKPQLGISAPDVQEAISEWLRRSRSPNLAPANARPPRGLDALVLYLDFDGVLHHQNVLWHARHGTSSGQPNFTLFEHATLLEQLLEPYPEVRIVLSTPWVRTHSCYWAMKRLRPGLRSRVLGATFHSKMNEQAFVDQPRGLQVYADVMRRQPRGWLALDNTDEGWPSDVREKVLLTDEQFGIAAQGMPELIAANLKRLAAIEPSWVWGSTQVRTTSGTTPC